MAHSVRSAVDRRSAHRRLARWTVPLAAVTCVLGGWAAVRVGTADVSTRLTRVLALSTGEGVFAYARISPDGRHLAYASERTGAKNEIHRTIRIVDLETNALRFTEPGIDAYWSPDGKQVIFRSTQDKPQVSLLDIGDGSIRRDIVRADVGDYYSWGRLNGRDTIMTITGEYFDLAGGAAVMPIQRMSNCSGLGVGLRPLLSRDARRVSVFTEDGQLAVRNLRDCADIVYVGMPAGKADFSADGRYVAFHAPKSGWSAGTGYDIWIADLQRMVRIRVTDLPGSSLFPSWTDDNRLCFRYDGSEYRGFLIASGFLQNTPLTLEHAPAPVSMRQPAWRDVFPDDPMPRQTLALVLVWAPWSAHSDDALSAFRAAAGRLAGRGIDSVFATAAEPGSTTADVFRFVGTRGFTMPSISMSTAGLIRAGAHNQMPTTLAFVNGRLAGRKLGAQTESELLDWVSHLWSTNRRG